MSTNPKAYRLPTHALPRRYDIHLDARLGREDFHGNLTIQLDVVESRDVIELNAKELQLNDVKLNSGGKTMTAQVSTDAEREMVALRFGESIPVGKATLEIAYDGKISRGLEGLYLAKDGHEQLICTQCEDTYARLILPCFDEPAFKAQFAWTITTSPDVTVLANGPLVETSMSNDGKSKTWTFAPTKTMSSYLIALVIGDVAGTPKENVNGTPISVWGMRGKEHMGQFAHSYTARVIPWFEDYFGVHYHFDKYDQAAVPGFAAGAMENAGLVLYRQNALLMNAETASWQQEKRIAHVIAHETAHMWFGDYVTMKWWDDLWLNEAFAEWVSHKVLDSLNPEYYIWNDFQGGKRGALAADALTSTHPIYTPVETPDEATELFDSITYEKGCSVLRMLETFLGEESFRSGIRTYMKEFAESNAAGSDLWRHLQAASDHPVTDIMETWIKQGGYPVVAVSLEQGGGSPSLHLSQKRFFSSPLAPAESDQIWKVPVVLHYEDDAGSHETRYLLTERETTLPLDVQGELRWCYANADEIGFYRQSPDDSLLDGLLANLDKLSPLEQMGLLGDQWALVRSGGQKISRFLDTLSAMFSIKQYSVLELVAFNLDRIEDLLEEAGDETALHNFRDWVERAFRPQLDELGFEPKKGEPQNDTQSRISVISALTGDAQDREAIDRSVQFAEREAKDPASVDPNLAPLFVWTAARYGDRARQDKFVKIYQERRTNGASPQETNRYLNTLPTFRPPEAVSRVLELIDEKVIPQEATGPTLSQMLSERHSQLQAWEYLKKHWDAVRTNYGDLWVGRLVEGTGRLPAEKRDEIVAFMDKNLNGVAEMSYARALETLDQLAEFKARTRGDLIGWFRK